MKILKIFLVSISFLLTIFCMNYCYANEYFDFNLNRYLVFKEDILEVNFYYDLENVTSSDFLVRPQIKNGVVNIYNPKSETWESESSLRSNLPLLEEIMKIKINGSMIKKTELNFEILSTKESKTYTTPKRTIWFNNSIYKEYNQLVNSSLNRSESNVLGSAVKDTIESTLSLSNISKSNIDNILENTSKEDKEEKENRNILTIFNKSFSLNKRIWLIIDGGIFLMSIFIGFLIHNARIKKCIT